MKRVMVTGGAGFIGSHLVRRLVEQSCDVIVVDDLSTGSADQVPVKASFVQADIVYGLAADFDEVYNLACPASPVHYQRDPVKTMMSNVLGSYHVLMATKRNAAKMLQTSTSEVYGDPLVHPQKEDYYGNVNSIGIRACYDEGKRAAESLCYDFQRQSVEVRVARIFNTYGPNMAINDGRVVSNFIVQALTNKDLTIYGDGNQTRSFCYVSDIIDGLMKLMASEMKSPVNLGNPEELTMLELSELVLKLTDSKSKIIFVPLPQDDPKQRRPDITKAKTTLGWEPKVGVEDGLRETIRYFRKMLA